jgi:hypothetical protein
MTNVTFLTELPACRLPVSLASSNASRGIRLWVFGVLKFIPRRDFSQ